MPLDAVERSSRRGGRGATSSSCFAQKQKPNTTESVLHATATTVHAVQYPFQNEVLECLIWWFTLRTPTQGPLNCRTVATEYGECILSHTIPQQNSDLWDF